MMKRTRVAVIGSAIVFLALSGAYAQGQEKFHQGGQGKKEDIFKELNLTPEQKQKLEDNRHARQQEMQNIREAHKAKHQKLQEKLKDPNVTRAAIEPLLNEVKSLQSKLIDNRINGIFEVKAILTPEQFTKFNQIMDKIAQAKKAQLKAAQDKRKGGPPEME